VPQVRIVRFPRYGLPRPEPRHARLGQINAPANLVPGQTYTFTYSIGPSDLQTLEGEDAVTLTEDAIANALASWSPFANGYLGFSDIELTSSTLTLSILANDGSQNLTQGNVGASIAATLNDPSQPEGIAVWNFTLTGAGTAGLQTPPGYQQLQSQTSQTPTPTITDTVKAILGTGPAIPPANKPSAPWYVYAAGLGLLGLVVYSSTQ
jgi:hypothetical protein